MTLDFDYFPPIDFSLAQPLEKPASTDIELDELVEAESLWQERSSRLSMEERSLVRRQLHAYSLAIRKEISLLRAANKDSQEIRKAIRQGVNDYHAQAESFFSKCTSYRQERTQMKEKSRELASKIEAAHLSFAPFGKKTAERESEQDFDPFKSYARFEVQEHMAGVRVVAGAAELVGEAVVETAKFACKVTGQKETCKSILNFAVSSGKAALEKTGLKEPVKKVIHYFQSCDGSSVQAALETLGVPSEEAKEQACQYVKDVGTIASNALLGGTMGLATKGVKSVMKWGATSAATEVTVSTAASAASDAAEIALLEGSKALEKAPLAISSSVAALPKTSAKLPLEKATGGFLKWEKAVAEKFPSGPIEISPLRPSAQTLSSIAGKKEIAPLSLRQEELLRLKKMLPAFALPEQFPKDYLEIFKKSQEHILKSTRLKTSRKEIIEATGGFLKWEKAVAEKFPFGPAEAPPLRLTPAALSSTVEKKRTTSYKENPLVEEPLPSRLQETLPAFVPPEKFPKDITELFCKNALHVFKKTQLGTSQTGSIEGRLLFQLMDEHILFLFRSKIGFDRLIKSTGLSFEEKLHYIIEASLDFAQRKGFANALLVWDPAFHPLATFLESQSIPLKSLGAVKGSPFAVAEVEVSQASRLLKGTREITQIESKPVARTMSERIHTPVLREKVKAFIKDESGGGKLPKVPSEWFELFHQIGYKLVDGGKGSHYKMRREGSPMIIIPHHRELSPKVINDLKNTYHQALDLMRIDEPAVLAKRVKVPYSYHEPFPHRLDYSRGYLLAKEDFMTPPKEFNGVLKRDLVVVQYHSEKPLGQGRSYQWFMPVIQANSLHTVEQVMDTVALLPKWGERSHVSVARIPAGERVRFLHGRAAAQIDEAGVAACGGGVQYRFFDFDPKWVVDTRKLPT